MSLPERDLPNISRIHREAAPESSRLAQAKAFLDSPKVGLKPLQPHEITRIQTTYSTRVKEAVAGNTTHLKMVDTLVDPERIAEGNFPPNVRVGVAEIGGTNLRVALLETDDQGKPHVMEVPAGRRGARQPAFMSLPLPQREFSSMEEFSGLVANKLHELVEIVSDPSKPLEYPNICGYIFSFSGTPVEHEGSVDVVFTESNLPAIAAKGFRFPGIEKKPVGVALSEALQAKFGVAIPALAVLNDTSVLPLSGGNLGVVVGTGANFAAVVGGKLYNTALPTFHEAPTHALMKELDPSGQASAFKEIGGMYLGELMALAIQKLHENELLHADLYIGKKITAADMATIVHGFDGEAGEERLHRIQQFFSAELDREDQQILIETARRLFDRSAQMMGVILATFINTFPHEFEDHEIIPAQGSVIWEAPLYVEYLTKEIKNHLNGGKTVEFSYHPYAGILGITHATLGVHQKNLEEHAA